MVGLQHYRAHSETYFGAKHATGIGFESSVDRLIRGVVT